MKLSPQPYAPIPMLPGPTSLPREVLEAMHNDYGSGFSEEAYQLLYAECTAALQRLLGTGNPMAIMTGEPMVALWGALKSCLKAGDTVVCIGTGFFGDGTGDMVRSIGCTVHQLSFPADSTLNCADALQQIEQTIKRHRPKMITAVHCETPSGTMNPLAELGALKKRLGTPLLYIDAVSSAGGVPINADTWQIDLLLSGPQKCFSAPPSLGMAAVSAQAWEIIKEVKYQGYDALLPFERLHSMSAYPYTPYWHGLAALAAGLRLLESEGAEQVYARHEQVAAMCRRGLQSMGIKLFPAEDAVPAATVTAAYIPKGLRWTEFNKRLQARGLVCTNTVGPYAEQVFRLGHMGTQAEAGLMEKALAAVKESLED